MITYGEVDPGTAEELAMQNVRIRMKGHQAYEESIKATYKSLMELYSDEACHELQQNAQDLIKRYSQNSKYTVLASDYIFPANLEHMPLKGYL